MAALSQKVATESRTEGYPPEEWRRGGLSGAQERDWCRTTALHQVEQGASVHLRSTRTDRLCHAVTQHRLKFAFHDGAPTRESGGTSTVRSTNSHRPAAILSQTGLTRSQTQRMKTPRGKWQAV